VQVNSADEYDAHIRDAAEMYHLPYELVKAVIAAESNFDPEAVSRAGARGLMQLMPATADEMYVWDPHDPIDAIYGGARYLRHLANQFGGDFIKTVAAYNAGPEAVRKAQGVPRYSETRTYVQKVVKFYKQFKGR
jgi:soluble lytic murein transglycosylase-like protein